MLSQIIDNQNKLLLEKEQEIAELKKECRRCVHTDCPCILSDFGKDRNGICDHFIDVFDENIELKDKLNNLASVAEVRLANWQKYEKKNAEQKKKIENLQKYLDARNCYRECAETWEKLTKTKDLLKKLYDETRGYINNQGFDIKILAETEQFLKGE